MADNDGGVNASLPLRGAVLCCTAITQDVRTKLVDVATQMGAVCKLDLTSDVTHLLVGNVSTPKYRYVAKERPDIKVLHPDWIDDLRECWLEGEDVDVVSLEEKHKLPTFFELQVCVTGFEDHEQRTILAETLQKLGATYHCDLTRRVTHLIAAAPKGAKYTHAKQWGLSIVSIKWFTDSVRREMALNESLYDPVVPIDEQGQGAFLEQPKSRQSLGKRERDGESQEVDDTGKRKLRRTMSARLSGHSQDLWQDMSAREVVHKQSEGDQWNEGDGQEGDPNRGSRQPKESDREGSSDASIGAGSRASKTLVRTSDAFQRGQEVSHESDGLFAGLHIAIHGFDDAKRSRLQQFLEPNGARIVPSSNGLQDASEQPMFRGRCLLVPHGKPDQSTQLPDTPPGTMIVTEWWVERCIHYKQMFEPSEDPLSQPLWDMSVGGFEAVTICTTGFSSVDVRQIAEAVDLMGAKYGEEFTPSTSVLISAMSSVKREKAYYATKHGIPVVSPEWLWACLKERKRVSYAGFEVQLPQSAVNVSGLETSASNPALSDQTSRKLNGRRLQEQDVSRQRLSNTRRRHATPTLPLQASKPNVPAPQPKTQPFVHEDDDDEDEPPLLTNDSTVEGLAVVPPASLRRSQPLGELSPNKSPRKSSQQQKHKSPPPDELLPTVTLNKSPRRASLEPDPSAAPPSPVTSERNHSMSYQQLPPRPQHELAADLASIMNRQMASRQNSASSDAPQKRKNRPLGRSTSGIGNRSATPSAQSDHPASPQLARSCSIETMEPPGTQLGYETADAEMHRLQMNKRMGLAPERGECGKRLASVGVVKDSGSDPGAGNRFRGKTRTR